MTGERFEWLKLASRLGRTVAELKEQIAYSEFVEWILFSDWERAQNTKEHHYLAQVAAEIRRSMVSKPNEVKMEDFLLIYETELEREQRSSKSKAIWAAHLGVKLDRN